MESFPHPAPSPSRPPSGPSCGKYQNAALTVIAGALCLLALDRFAGPALHTLNPLDTPAAAQFQPQPRGVAAPPAPSGMANDLEQRQQIIAELRGISAKMDRLDAKLSGTVNVKVTDMPPIKLPDAAKAGGGKP